MKGPRSYIDLGNIFDEIFETAQEFKDQFSRNFNNCQGERGFNRGHEHVHRHGPFPFDKQFFDENTDFYPNYSYPPMNVYMTEDKSLVFEFALAGFNENDISLSFQGDYMVFSAKLGPDPDSPVRPRENGGLEDNVRYFKRRLKMKDIEKQKYFVPLDKYAQDKVKALYKNGILRVSIPPKDEVDQNDGIKIEIVKEGV
ncbi:MAG: Hsp20/alpha crystallin family protein [Treponema sp.]|nr:Hsp20/alpha crystallin family protein [Treponema sp.]